MDMSVNQKVARLDDLGLIAVSGADARAFLHAQLTIDLENLAANRAAYGGWCSAKGRLLASVLVVPHGAGFLLQLSRDLAAAVVKRLAMYVLRSKVKLENASDQWSQYGVWSADVPRAPMEVESSEGRVAVRLDPDRLLLIVREPLPVNDAADEWALADIRAGRPRITQATQDQFVPQMVNLELLSAVDFAKGCYPGQEIVARTQYRGELKRRMYRVRSEGSLRPGQELFSDDHPGQPCGTVVNAAGGEALAVLQIATVENKAPVRPHPGGPPLEILSLPYSQ